MLHQWARELGERVPVVATYPAEEFIQWCAYQQVDPSCEERADLRFAMIATLIANAMRGKGKPPAKMEDFMLFRHKEPQTPEQMAAIFAGLATE